MGTWCALVSYRKSRKPRKCPGFLTLESVCQRDKKPQPKEKFWHKSNRKLWILATSGEEKENQVFKRIKWLASHSVLFRLKLSPFYDSAIKTVVLFRMEWIFPTSFLGIWPVLCLSLISITFILGSMIAWMIKWIVWFNLSELNVKIRSAQKSHLPAFVLFVIPDVMILCYSMKKSLLL